MGRSRSRCGTSVRELLRKSRRETTVVWMRLVVTEVEGPTDMGNLRNGEDRTQGGWREAVGFVSLVGVVVLG